MESYKGYDYRLIRIADEEEPEGVAFGVYEVYYNPDGTPKGRHYAPIVYATTIDEVAIEVHKIAVAMTSPVLDDFDDLEDDEDDASDGA